MGQSVINTFTGILISIAITLPATASEIEERLNGYYELEIIGDFGGQSAKPFLPSNSDFKARLQKLKNERRGKRFVASNIPVTSPSLLVGKVTDQEAAGIKYQMLSRPLFLIGYDPVSIQWLRNNRQFLADKKAIGLVVNVETVEQMNYLQTIVGRDILLQPTPGEQMANALNIRHYPFYVDQSGVMR